VIRLKKRILTGENIRRQHFFTQQHNDNRFTTIEIIEMEEQQGQQQFNLSFFKNPIVSEFLGGTAGGLTGVLSGHPADTIRVRLQTADGTKYKGFFDCAKQTFRHESITGLYKGLIPPLVGETMNNCVLFGVYGVLKPWQEQFSLRARGADDYSLAKDLGGIAASGAIAGACISLIVCPTELVKIQFQNNTSATQKETIFGCIQRMQRERNSVLAGTFHGYCATMWRELSFGASYFLFYECAKRSFAKLLHDNSHNTHDLGILALLLSGGLAGTGAWAFSYPTDYVKSCVQADSKLNTRKMLNKIVYEDRSLRSAYKGFAPTVLRAFPVNAITFLSYELISGFLKDE
jgi:solute carrier family 25 carnitine/acylcarnitine transporter 20/29